MDSIPTSPSLSVVIPTLDEAERIGACLASVGEDPGVEVVVSDGGSSDGTLEAVRRLRPGAAVVEGPRGRGGQLNRGAAVARGDRLLFLHADCRLPARWSGAVRRALDDPEAVLVCFRLRTEPSDGGEPGPWRRFWLGLHDLRSRGWGLPYGDQGFALRREVFDALGGFADIPLMEDLDLARRCRRAGAIVRLPEAVLTTARRFEQRPVRSRVILALFPALFRLGVSPERLSRWYGVVR
jgi:rSAM/selenodomain-associated transferase 2